MGLGNSMEEILAKRLEIFGFTQNQAKIYLAVVQAGSISVSEIGRRTNLHRQDIYKMLPKLEAKGLVTKTLGSPLVLNAIPVEKALKGLIAVEKERATERIKRMEANLGKLSGSLSALREREAESEGAEPFFTLLTNDSEVTNAADLLFARARDGCDIVGSVDLIELRAGKWRERFRKAVDNGARIRLIVKAPVREAKIDSLVQRLRPPTGDFAAKFFLEESPKPFALVDNREVWISTAKVQSCGLPCVLWTNGGNIVNVYRERFDRFWNSRVAAIIGPAKKTRRKKDMPSA
jgi:HTH-type transcriptional regulator, sugar sensing transcriptional regulator